jgi:hypothetical protein
MLREALGNAQTRLGTSTTTAMQQTAYAQAKII